MKEDMEKLINFSDLEAILRTAIKLSCFSAKKLAEVANMSKSGFYCFTSGKNHISTDKGDTILAYLREKDPKCIDLAANLHFLWYSVGVGGLNTYAPHFEERQIIVIIYMLYIDIITLWFHHKRIR